MYIIGQVHMLGLAAAAYSIRFRRTFSAVLSAWTPFLISIPCGRLPRVGAVSSGARLAARTGERVSSARAWIAALVWELCLFNML